jgi:hypothetical protein
MIEFFAMALETFTASLITSGDSVSANSAVISLLVFFLNVFF